MGTEMNSPTQWHGCYDQNWKGVITSESFAHPAKMARGLLTRIITYGLEKGWWKAGDDMGDPFGGVGTTAIMAAYYGLRVICNELESKFVKLARGHHCTGYDKAQWRAMYGRFGRFDGLCPTCQRTAGAIGNSRVIPEKEPHYFTGNFDLHDDKWDRLGLPAPVMNRGDSRYFDQIVHAILTSPPYVSGGHHTDVMQGGNRNGRGQLGAAITSPPYSGSLDDGGPEKQHPDGYERSNNWTGYGKSPGQIAALKSGEVDAVVTSPPFLGARSDTTDSAGGIAKEGYEGKEPSRPSHKKLGERTYRVGAGDHRSEGNIETAPAGEISAVISSPPYETIAAGAGGLNTKPAKEGQQGGRKKGASQDTDQRYGATPGQIAAAEKGKVDAVISSPPYADSVHSKSHGIDFSKAKPDYPGRVETEKRVAQHSERAENMIYGETEGQIGALPSSKLEAVVTSPPWEDNAEGGRSSGKFKGDTALWSRRGKGATDEAVRAQAERDQHKTYGQSEGQIGTTRGQTYWEAMAQVYLACFDSLRAGGHMAIVVKDFVKDGKRMRLCDDTMKLLVWCGFEEVERIHAMLVHEQEHEDLFGGTIVERTERKSFFRRLHESKLAPDDERRIDYEEVLIVRKP
jgi:hypothetical protein